MPHSTHVYWKRRADCTDSFYISGSCQPEDVPSYGEVGHLALPTAVTTTLDEQGTLRAYSPLVFGTSKVYRYALTLTANARASIGEMSDYMLDSQLQVQVFEAPHKGADRANWWWYAHENWRGLSYGQDAPTRLKTTWKGAMLAILLEGRADKDERLAAWEARVQSHKTYTREKNAKRPRRTPKKDGDLVVMPHPTYFANGVVRQIFRYHINTSSGYKRASHELIAASTRHTIPHGDADTFPKGVASLPDLLPATRCAMLLLAWARAPMHTSHALLSAKRHYTPLFEEAQRDLQAALEGVPNSQTAYSVAAAVQALRDFGGIRNDADGEVAAAAREEVRALMRAFVDRHAPLGEALTTARLREQQDSERAYKDFKNKQRAEQRAREKALEEQRKAARKVLFA